MKKYIRLTKGIVLFVAALFAFMLFDSMDVKATAEFLNPAPTLEVPVDDAPEPYENWQPVWSSASVAYYCYTPETYSFNSNDHVEFEIKTVEVIKVNLDVDPHVVDGGKKYAVLQYQRGGSPDTGGYVYSYFAPEMCASRAAAFDSFVTFLNSGTDPIGKNSDRLDSYIAGRLGDGKMHFGLRRAPSSTKKKEQKQEKLTEEELQELIEALKALGIDYYAETGTDPEELQKAREEEALKAPDKDTNKSVLPSKSLIADTKTNAGSGAAVEFKAHEMAVRDSTNQLFLANSFATLDGKKAKVVMEYSVYPNRDLTTTENGSKTSLTVSNVPANPGEKIFAVGYNQLDGAYYLKSFVDKEKKAQFSDFKLRPASNLTLFVEE